jgi:anthranilate phosphoribosyltransferase
VQSSEGADELTSAGVNRVYEFTPEGEYEFSLEPQDFFGSLDDFSELQANTKAENLQVMKELLQNQVRPAVFRSVTLNVAAALTVSGKFENLGEAVQFVQVNFDSRKIRKLVERL